VSLAAALFVSRFVHYLATSILFGAALFPLHGIASATDAHRAFPWLRALPFHAAWLAFISGIAWFVFSAAEISASPAGIIAGRVWVFRLVLAAGLVLLLLPRRLTTRRNYAALAASLILLASIPWIGHGGSDGGASAPVRAFHLVAAGVWTGALIIFAQLTVLAARRLRDDELRSLHYALEQFSGVGSVVVGVLILTGIILFGRANTSDAYDQALFAKLAMFAAMLAFAAANRFWLTPQLSARLGSTDGLANAVHALRISLVAETALALLVFAAVALLDGL
jgi:putative copper resistance protein D